MSLPVVFSSLSLMYRRLGGDSNQEIVLSGFVLFRSCVRSSMRSGCLVDVDRKRGRLPFHFSFSGRLPFPFFLLGRRAFPFPLCIECNRCIKGCSPPHPPNLLSNFSWAYRSLSLSLSLSLSHRACGVQPGNRFVSSVGAGGLIAWGDSISKLGAALRISPCVAELFSFLPSDIEGKSKEH